MRVALIHDWLTGMRGGERVLEAVCKIYPEADIHTLFHFRGKVSPTIESHRIQSSFLQYSPFLNRYYRYHLPIFPHAIKTLNLHSYDLILSFSHCVAHGAPTKPTQCHICYCFTPMRYIWDQYDTYFRNAPWPMRKLILPRTIKHLRQWDRNASRQVNAYLTSSHLVHSRIQKYYNRQAEIVAPPVDSDFFTPGNKKDDYFLIVSALSPYKRLDLAIQACNRLQLRLKIIGWGPEKRRLQLMAGPTVEFLGRLPDTALLSHYRQCRALLFPGLEDFGITPLEAQACGRPVIAFRGGGVSETVIEPETGIFFEEQTVDSLISAIRRFQSMQFTVDRCRKQADRFSLPRFESQFKSAIEKQVAQFDTHRHYTPR